MAEALLNPQTWKGIQEENDFGCGAREIAMRLLAWTHCQPAAATVDVLVEELMRGQDKAHWGTTQGNAWALYALTEYARRVEGQLKPAEGTLTFGDRSAPFQLPDQAGIFETTFPLSSGLAAMPLVLTNSLHHRLFTTVKLETRPPVVPSSHVDRGYLIHRSYTRLDDGGAAPGSEQLRVGDSVLVSLRLEVRQPAHYVAIDDALPATFEAINPEFNSRQSLAGSGAGVPPAPASENWFSDFHELRNDRALFFRDHLGPGTYTIRYLARVRAAGTATAPPAKVEEMYHPERYGLSGTMKVSSLPML